MADDIALATEVRALRLLVLLMLKDRFAEATFPDHLVTELQTSATILSGRIAQWQKRAVDKIDGQVALELGDILRPLADLAKSKSIP